MSKRYERERERDGVRGRKVTRQLRDREEKKKE